MLDGHIFTARCTIISIGIRTPTPRQLHVNSEDLKFKLKTRAKTPDSS
jgi:hypothetical protein